MKEVSDNNNVQFIDIFDLLELSDLDDGLHPNEKGHQKIAEVIAENISN